MINFEKIKSGKCQTPTPPPPPVSLLKRPPVASLHPLF